MENEIERCLGEVRSLFNRTEDSSVEATALNAEASLLLSTVIKELTSAVQNLTINVNKLSGDMSGK